MGYHCDYCGEARSMVYCRSDAACMCLSCDRLVHSSNALSKRHSRTLVCDMCNSQPAIRRCIEEKISLCENCDWKAHTGSTKGSTTHNRHALSYYSGCPSAAELSSIWPFMSDLVSAMDSMSIADNSQDLLVTGDASGLQSRNNSNVLMDSSSIRADNMLQNVVQQVGPANSSPSKRV